MCGEGKKNSTTIICFSPKFVRSPENKIIRQYIYIAFLLFMLTSKYYFFIVIELCNPQTDGLSIHREVFTSERELKFTWPTLNIRLDYTNPFRLTYVFELFRVSLCFIILFVFSDICLENRCKCYREGFERWES